MTLVSQRLHEVALDRNLRGSTVGSYARLIGRLRLLDREVETVTRAEVLDLLWKIPNPNSRRATVIALRSVLGWTDLKIPKGIARRYQLPDETTVKLALSLTPHQIRGELMAFAGLRSGEAAAITRADVQGDRLRVDKQIAEHTNLLSPVKSTEADVIIPWWLAQRLETVTTTVKPASVRESLRRAGMKCGIHLSPHMLRKYYITRLIAAGVPLELVRLQARHSSITVTLTHYEEYSDQQIHDVLG
jgi:integrase